MENVKKISSCRICKSKRLKKVISLGSSPIANAFLTQKQIHQPESYYPLETYLCLNCGLVQLGHVVSPDLLFKNYLYVSSTSPVFIKHFEDYAAEVFHKFHLGKKSLVIDIGSNDGILLKPFKKLGAHVLGIDPAKEIANKATKSGLETIPSYFDTELAQELVKSHGKAKVITANNVFAHVDNIDELTEATKILLDKNGVFIIEAPYLVNFIEQNLFDTIYHEHLSYLSIKPLTVFFKIHDMRIFATERTSSHGGSIRVFVTVKNSKYKTEKSVKESLKEEINKKIHLPVTWEHLALSIKQNKIKLTGLLNKLKTQGKSIVGYGAPAKGNTLLNFFGIGNDILDYIVDDSPLKQGLFAPGTHIPIVALKEIAKTKPDYILILAWNFAESIIQKLHPYSEQGGSFIIPVPSPRIVKSHESSREIIEEDIQNIIKGLGNDIYKLENKTLLISGGSGFLGSYINQVIYHLNKAVFKKPCKVISIDNYITGSAKKNFIGNIEDPNIEFVFHDIRLPILIRERVDYIIHAAGLASPYYYQKYPLETIESAVIGAKNLLELARSKQVGGFLFFSSSEIYGDPDTKHVPTPETYAGHVSSIGPRACYDESKRLGETLCLVYHQQFGVPTKIVRPFNIYGPGMKPNDYRVIPTFLYHGLRNEALPVHDKGKQTRTFCYISDGIIGFFKVLLSGKSGEAYNIGNAKPEITMESLAKTVVKILNNRSSVKKISYPSSYPAGEPQRRCPDLTKAKSHLKYSPKIDLEAGLKRTISWYKSKYNL